MKKEKKNLVIFKSIRLIEAHKIEWGRCQRHDGIKRKIVNIYVIIIIMNQQSLIKSESIIYLKTHSKSKMVY